MVMKLPHRIRSKSLLLFTLFLPLLFASITFELDQAIYSHESSLAQEDTLRPEVSEWGLTGNYDQGGAFTAWANVSDNDSGVKNVTFVIDPFEDYHPMTFNGSFYEVFVAPLEVNYTYSVWIEAFDNASNRATTYVRIIDLTIGNYTPFDQTVTMPVVVGSSLALMAGAISLAYVYDKRQKTDNASYTSDDAEPTSTE